MSEDLQFLRSRFSVDHLITAGVVAPIAILKHLPGAALTFTWFASVYAGIVVFLARLFGKRTLVVVGGVDLARFPEIGYGLWTSRWKSAVATYTLRHADRVLAVDQYLVEQTKSLARYDGHNVVCVPTGYDAATWTPLGPKEHMVLTVAICTTPARAKVKGIDILLDAARAMGSTPFVIIGMSQAMVSRFGADAPPNVTFLPPLEKKELLEHYRKARVYCQPSLIEGFPNSVCEAMLCECIPVGTNVGGTVTAIGTFGKLVPYGDVAGLVASLSSALEQPPEDGAKAREHIVQNFPTQRREEMLLKIIGELTQ